MIILTGMRTDIPAFYSQWFLNRVKQGFVCVRNPYNEHQVTKYILDPKVVDCICFCTKNPAPMLPHLNELKDYKQFWYVTITPYDKTIEPNVPDKSQVIQSFIELSKKVGKNAVGWRYDPVFFGGGFDLEKHVQCFESIAQALKDYTNFCVLSFLDLYDKVRKNAPNIRPPSFDEQLELAKRFVQIAKDNNLTIRTCCEGKHLARFGVDVNGCQTKEIIEQAIGLHLNPPKQKNVRRVCNCLLGQDIGAYNTCLHMCKYCYANMDKQTVLQNVKKHDPNSPFLVGNLMPEDKITEAKQNSYVDNQTTMF